MNPASRSLLFLLALALLGGCGGLVSRGGRLAGDISRAMLNQDDPDIVRAGAPAYLLLLEGMIEEAPDDRTLLTTAARLYGAYATLLQDDARRKRLSTKAKRYARRAFCGAAPARCGREAPSFSAFALQVDAAGEADLPTLYTYGVSWAGWIQAHRDDWTALADLPRVEYLLQRVITLAPQYDRGRAQLYLGILHTQLPAAMGGRPEVGRGYFERALRYSNGRDLMAKVEFARRYARLVFDRPLHDRLLNEVLAANPDEPGLTLSNTLARRQAQALLADDYF